MNLILDKWQEDVLNTKGNIAIRAGRQVGKSTIISILGAKYAANNANKQVLIISATERQAYLLFSKVLMYLDDNFPNMLKKGKERPTKSEIKLRNGSIIRCLPTGLDGLGIRGYTTNMLIADEAHFIPEDVWEAVNPQLVTTEAIQILISTTHGREGHFYRAFISDNFTKFHVTTEQVAESRPEPMRSRMLSHLESEKSRMGQMQYAQEYLAEFVDDLRQYFPDDLIKKCMKAKRPEVVEPSRRYFLGIDIARMGDDETTFEVFDRTDKERLVQVLNLITKKTTLDQTYFQILQLDKVYKFKRVYIDTGGIGVGVYDFLKREESIKGRVIGINNRAKSEEEKDYERLRLLKEDLYANLMMLMLQGKIELLQDDELFQSFKSVQYEYKKEKNQYTSIEIFGNYTHIVEGVTRAAWSYRDKSLNIWVGYTGHGI